MAHVKIDTNIFIIEIKQEAGTLMWLSQVAHLVRCYTSSAVTGLELRMTFFGSNVCLIWLE